MLLGKRGPVAKKVPLIRTSERTDFKHCQWYWYMRWVCGWTPRRQPTWAWFGIAIHKGLEARYPVGRKRGSVAAMLAAFERALEGEKRRMLAARTEWDEDEMVDALELGKAMLRGYVETYGRDLHWDVVGTEQAFQIDVVDKRGKLLAIYCGTWDLLVWDRIQKVYRLVDHKTARAFQPMEWLTINDQAGSYLWVAPEVLRGQGIFTGGEVIDGIEFNYLKKSMPDERPRNEKGEALNKDGTVSARQPAQRFLRRSTYREPIERVTQYRRVVAEARQMRAVRSGRWEATKHPTHDCVRCPLFDVCELHEQGGDYKALLKHAFVKADPYADHREAVKDGNVYIITSKEG